MLLEKELLQEIINESSLTGCDFVEVFVEDTTYKSTNLLGGKIESLNESRIKGVGLRLALSYNYVYGYTNDLSRESLLKLARELRESFNEPRKEVVPLKDEVVGKNHRSKINLENISNEKRVDLMMEAYNAAKEYNEEISQVSIRLYEKHQNVTIAKMDGRLVSDERTLTRFTVTSFASKEGKMESGSASIGKSKGFEIFEEDIDIYKLAKEASRCAMANLYAEDCPSGEMPVIIENDFGGVIFHEAVSHSLEATSVGKGMSVFCNMLNKKVANECVSAYDDGTIENEWGSESFDDEGTPQEKRELIKNGVLTSYMIDELNAKRMGMNKTGSARRESYKYAPTSRMSNTYIAKGTSSLEDMLKDIKFGLYCKTLGGGSVDPTTGDFNFAVNEAYLIRDSKICECVKGASLVGNGRDTLASIVMVGDNVGLAPGMCGSQSGSVPVTVGQPRIKVSKMIVGGRNREC